MADQNQKKEPSCLRDEWKETGKGIGKSFAGLGKTMIRSAKVGVDAVSDDGASEGEKESLKQSWSDVGHNFGKAASGFGKAMLHSVKKGADCADAWANGEDAPKTSNSGDKTTVEGEFEEKN